jgi:hypothetical protein
MKKSVITSFILLLAVFYAVGTVTASSCALDVSLLNQDPSIAIPGDYVKVVFQVTGLENPECKTIVFGLKEAYPFYLDPGVENPITLKSGTFQVDYSPSRLIPYKLRVDENTLNGENPIEVYYSNELSTTSVIKDFNISVEDTRADFEVNVKNYDYTTRDLTLEILNTGKTNVKALTIEIPKQDSIEVKGANRVVVGDLDSNEYTTADFEAIMPKTKTEITLNILYTDSIDVRREMNTTVTFDPSYFTNRDIPKKTPWFWIILIVAFIGFFVYRRIKKSNAKKKLLHKQQHSGH